ncbi:MAG TPA: molybdopterin cofactor-binding domain-containing protein [Thermoanaerobaculia bacterium]|jgi:isoquinoline 1-oxidoreductase beta subunit
MKPVLVKISRRNFLRRAGLGAGALAFAYYFPGEAGAALDPRSLIHREFPLPGVDFVLIQLDGTMTILAHRAEMGQGIRSSLAALLVDEIGADWNRVHVRQADADAYKFGVPLLLPLPGTPAIVKSEDAQFVDSSRSMAAYYQPMRAIGAGIRLTFIRAGARKLGVDPSTLDLRNHKVVEKNGTRSVDIKNLLISAKKVQAPTTNEAIAFIRPRSESLYLKSGGPKMPLLDGKDMVTGKAVYGADVDPGRPGMLTAVIERCPVANGELQSFDATEALKVAGVRHVVAVLPDDFVKRFGAGGVGASFIPHAGVAVIADNTWAALQGRRKLKVQWNIAGSAAAYNADYDTDVFRQHLRESVAEPGEPVRVKGDVDAAFAGATPITASYHVPHLAQTPMEPPAAVAVYDNGKWEIWTPSQGPELAQHYIGLYMLESDPLNWLAWQAEEDIQLRDCERPAQDSFNAKLAARMGITVPQLMERRDEIKKKIRDNIKVHVTLLGGGFGRKSNPDYAAEAAFLARQFPGTPIRVQWTREDDIKFSFYNATAEMAFKGAVSNGKATAWQERSAFTSFFATLFPPPSNREDDDLNDLWVAARAGFHNGGKYLYGSAIELAQGLADLPYDIPNIRLENNPAEVHIRCGWMRSVANIYHAFGACSFMDELAIAAGRDPRDFLLDTVGDVVLRRPQLVAQQVQCLDNNMFPTIPMQMSIGKGNDRLQLIGEKSGEVLLSDIKDLSKYDIKGYPAGEVFEVIPEYPSDARRLRGVIERVARESNWDEKVRRYRGTKRGLGIAAHRSFLSYMAAVIDVEVGPNNELIIHDIWGALDCGLAVNRDRVIAQMEGGINYGLSIALFGLITVKNGAVVQNNFDDYPVLRIHQTPKVIHTYIQEPPPAVVAEYAAHKQEVPPTGVGEPPTPVIPPALANAIVAAGGPRLREIPFGNVMGIA